MADLFGVDIIIAADMATLFTCLAAGNEAAYPAEYCAAIAKLIAEWRPDIWVAANASG